MPQQGTDDQDRGACRGEGAATQQHPPPRRPGSLGGQHRLAKDYLTDETAEKIAAALLGPKARRAPLIDAEGAGQYPGQPIDRRSFLRAGGDVNAPQHRRRVEPRTAERLLQKFGERRFHAGELRREPGDQTAPLRAALGL